MQRLGLREQLGRRLEVTLGAPQTGHGDVPAVAVLQQGRGLAERPGGVEVLSRGLELILFDEHVGQTDVQVAEGGQRGTGMPLRRRQGVLLEPSGLVGSPPRHPHAGQGHRAAELVGDVACLGHAADRVGERVDRLLGVAPPQAASPRKPSAPARAMWSSGPVSARALRACCAMASVSPRA